MLWNNQNPLVYCVGRMKMVCALLVTLWLCVVPFCSSSGKCLLIAGITQLRPAEEN